MTHRIRNCLILLTLLQLCSCQKYICPAYQSTFLLRMGEAEEFFSYFAPEDSLPRYDSQFRGKGKNRFGLIRKRGNVFVRFFQNEEKQPSKDFMKVVPEQYYCPDSTELGLFPEDEKEKDKKKVPRAYAGVGQQEAPVDDTEESDDESENDDLSLMDTAPVEEDFPDDFTDPDPAPSSTETTSLEDEPLEEEPSEKAEKDSVQLRFFDQTFYESIFGGQLNIEDSLAQAFDDNIDKAVKAWEDRKKEKKQKKRVKKLLKRQKKGKITPEEEKELQMLMETLGMEPLEEEEPELDENGEPIPQSEDDGSSKKKKRKKDRKKEKKKEQDEEEVDSIEELEDEGF